MWCDILDRTPAWDFPRGPVGVRALVSVGAAYGLSNEQCLRSTGFQAADLADTDLRVEAGQELQVIGNLIASLGDRPGLGIEVAVQLRHVGLCVRRGARSRNSNDLGAGKALPI
jgi:hypothetical protein